MNNVIKVVVIAVGVSSLTFASYRQVDKPFRLMTAIVPSDEARQASVDQATKDWQDERRRQCRLPKSQRDWTKAKELKQVVTRAVAMKNWSEVQEALMTEQDPEKVKAMLMQGTRCFIGVEAEKKPCKVGTGKGTGIRKP